MLTEVNYLSAIPLAPGELEANLAEVLIEMQRVDREIRLRAAADKRAVRRARELFKNGRPAQALTLLQDPLQI